MGKKLDLLRRSESRDSLDSDSIGSRDSLRKRTPLRGGKSSENINTPTSTDSNTRSSIKGFFNRLGYNNQARLQTGSFRASEKPPEPELYRSVSTSHLVTSYVRGDDPADCLDKPAPSDKDANYPMKTMSCDNISRLGQGATPSPKKANFPYAFLRSKLSVLPEENVKSGLSCSKFAQSDSFSAYETLRARSNSEEHFPNLKIEPTIECSTLGRRKKPSLEVIITKRRFPPEST